MAVAAVSNNVTRVEAFNAAPAGTINGTGGGPAAASAAGLQYEGAQSLSRRINATNADHGFDYQHTATFSMYTAGNEIWLAKGWTVLGAVINAQGFSGGIGDADGSMYNFIMGDDGSAGDNEDFLNPPSGGYVFTPFEARVNAWHTDSRDGTADISVADTVEFIWNVSATTGAGISSSMDAWDHTADGLFLVGGDGADADANFANFVAADQGTIANRWGLWREIPAGTQAYLTNVIGRNDAGTITATDFTDSNFNVVFPGGLVSDGRNGLEFDLGDGTTGNTVTLSDGTIAGRSGRFGGRTRLKRYFDTEFDVNGTTDRITITGHGFFTGDAVIYSAEGGTEDIGPDATNGEAEFNTAGAIGTGPYWYVVKIDDDTIQLKSTAFDAYNGTGTAEVLTASTAGNGELHSLTRAPETVPNVEFTRTGAGTGSADLTRVSLTLTRIITLDSAVTLNTCVIGQGRQLVLNDATLNSCIIANPIVPIGEAYLESIHAQDLDLIDGTSFTSGGEGHAIEVTTNGTVAQNTGALQDVDFTDYWSGDEDNTGGISFNASTGVASNQITFNANHNMTTGDPFYYSDEGGTAITGLTDQALYFAEVVDADTIYVHPSPSSASQGVSGNRITLTAGVSETHKFYSANAAFFNNTGGAVTLNLNGGTSPSVRNSAGSTTTVNNTVTLTVTVLDENGTAVEGARVRIERTSDGSQIAQGSTNVSGVFSDSNFNYVSDTDVLIKVRLKGFRNFRTTGTITSNGLTVGVRFVADPIVDLP